MAEVTVDRLKVEVEATAKGANQVFKQLESQLKALKSSATGFNTSGLTNLTNALNRVATSLDNISSKINTVNNTTATPKVNTSGVTSSEKKIDSSISKIRESLAGLTAYGNAAMSGDSSALTSFDRRVTSIQSSIDVLKSRLESLGDTTVKVNAIDYYESKIEKAKDAIDQLVAKENEFKANGTDTGEAWDTLQAKLAETRDQLDALIQRQSEFSAGDMIDVDAFEDQKAALADFESQLHTTSDTVHNAVSTMNSQPVDIDTTPSQSNLSALAATLGSVSAQLLSVVGSTVISGFSKLSSAIKSVRNGISSLKSKVSGLSGTFNKGFFTILKYGFGIRSLYVLFRRLRQAVKDSFTELQNSGAYYETTRANVEALKSSLSILKYQFGAAFETIFNTVAPALQTFINYLISAMNTLSAFIAKLTGKSTYSKAVKATSDIAGNAGSAADSVKEMAKQLQGFDELNNLSGNSSGGSGGGGGSSGDSSGVTYVTESVDNALGSFTKALSDSISNGEWEQVGKLLSDKLIEMMKEVKWNDIYKKAENFGTDLASFLNGLFSTNENGENVFTSTGETIANALNAALAFLNSFGDTFDWTGFGSSMASGINKFFSTFKFDELGDAAHTWVGGILDAGIQLLTDTDFELIGTKIGEFLERCKIGDLASKLKELAIQIIKGLGQAITGLKKSDVPELETGILAVLGTLAITKSIPATLSIAATLAGIWLGTKYYEILSGNTVDQSFLEEIGDILEGFFGENSVEINISEAISFVWDELTGQNDKEATQFEKDLKAWLFTGLSYATGLRFVINIAKIVSFNYSTEGKDWENFKTDFWNGIKGAISTLLVNGSPFSIPVNLFKILDFVTEGTELGNAINDLKSKFEEKWKKIWEGETYSETGANGMPSDVASQVVKTKGLKDLGKDMIEGIIQGFKDEFKAWTQPIKDMLDQIIKDIKDIFGINSPAKEMEPYGKYIFEGIVKGFKDAFSELKEKIKELPGKIKEWIEEFFENFSLSDVLLGAMGTTGVIISIGVDLVQNGWSTVTGWVNDAKQKGSELIQGFVKLAKETGADAWDSITGWLETNGGSRTIDGLVNLSKQFGSSIASWIYDNGGSKVVTGLVDLKERFGGSIAAWLNNNGGSKVTNGFVKLKQKGWKTIAQFVKKVSGSEGMKANAIVGLTTVGSNWNKYSSVASWVNQWNKTDVEAKVNLIRGNFNDVTSWILSVFGSAAKNNGNGTVTITDPRKADGGSYYGGRWHSIPQYAKGTLNALNRGSMFIAGEAGPEVVGHINGRTEVLNRSQIAATMNSAIINGMSRFRNMQFNPALATPYSGYAYSSDFSDNSYRDNDTAIMEQNRLLAEQNRLLEQILQKPTGISKRDVFEANRSEANNYFNRTGNSPFLF